jgi:hypothetical protein
LLRKSSGVNTSASIAARRVAFAAWCSSRATGADATRARTGLLGESGENILPRVRARLAPGTQYYPDFEGVAARLCMSGRTVKRQ